MILRDLKVQPSEIRAMTYREMLLEVMRSLDPQRRPASQEKAAEPEEEVDDETYMKALQAMMGQRGS